MTGWQDTAILPLTRHPDSRLVLWRRHLRKPREKSTVIPAQAGIHATKHAKRSVVAKVMPRIRQPAVYLLASQPRGTLYVGVTSDLVARVHQHKHDLVAGFTQRYRVHTLVWYELSDTMEAAILREKQIKAWKRAWKLQLIESTNPCWSDLYPGIV